MIATNLDLGFHGNYLICPPQTQWMFQQALGHVFIFKLNPKLGRLDPLFMINVRGGHQFVTSRWSANIGDMSYCDIVVGWLGVGLLPSTVVKKQHASSHFPESLHKKLKKDTRLGVAQHFHQPWHNTSHLMCYFSFRQIAQLRSLRRWSIYW